jgi:hypothetical protein
LHIERMELVVGVEAVLSTNNSRLASCS